MFCKSLKKWKFCTCPLFSWQSLRYRIIYGIYEQAVPENVKCLDKYSSKSIINMHVWQGNIKSSTIMKALCTYEWLDKVGQLSRCPDTPLSSVPCAGECPWDCWGGGGLLREGLLKLRGGEWCVRKGLEELIYVMQRRPFICKPGPDHSKDTIDYEEVPAALCRFEIMLLHVRRM